MGHPHFFIIGSAFCGLVLAATTPFQGQSDVQPPTRLPGTRPTIRAGQYPTLQAAIDALPPEGGKILLPAGTFAITEPLVITQHDVLLQGSGTASHIKNMNTAGKSGLILRPKETPSKPEEMQWRVMLADFRLTGNEKSGHGISAKDVDELFIRGVKRDVYEGGIRIPMIVRWPGHVPVGGVSDQIWAFWDVLPTLAEVAGVAPPEEIDGISMLPALLGQPQRHQHAYLYWDYGHTHGTYCQAVRMGDWKGVRSGPGAAIELYNLARDVAESSDVATTYPQQVERIERCMREAYVESADYPIRRTGK